MTREELEALDIEALDKLAFGVNSGNVIDLLPNQINILYEGDLENPEALFERGGMTWANSVDLSEPIEVSIDTAGRYNLEDGHHRWLAAQERDVGLKALIEIKGNPIERILEKRREHQEATQAILSVLAKPPVSNEMHDLVIPTDIEDTKLLCAALENEKSEPGRWRLIECLVQNGANPACIENISLFKKVSIGALSSMLFFCLMREVEAPGVNRSSRSDNIFHLLAKTGRHRAIKLSIDEWNALGMSTQEFQALQTLLGAQNDDLKTPVELLWSNPEFSSPITRIASPQHRTLLSDLFHATAAMSVEQTLNRHVIDRVLECATLLNEETYPEFMAKLETERQSRDLDARTVEIKKRANRSSRL